MGDENAHTKLATYVERYLLMLLLDPGYGNLSEGAKTKTAKLLMDVGKVSVKD